jgi:CBS domain-containing protein
LVNLTGDVFPETVRYGFGHLGWINLALGVFNMLPGFPLDGGRVLRSFIWQITGSMDRATKAATTGGKVIASLLIGLGLLEVFGGNLGGLWYAAIGWFLFQAAAVSGQQVIMRRLFEGMVAADVMSPRLVALSTESTVQEAVDDYFLRFDHSAFPVQDAEGKTTGILTLRAVRQVPRDQWPIIQVWSVMTRIVDTPKVGIDAPIQDVVHRLEESEDHRVLVVDGSAVVGIITSRDIARWVRRSDELGLTEPG